MSDSELSDNALMAIVVLGVSSVFITLILTIGAYSHYSSQKEYELVEQGYVKQYETIPSENYTKSFWTKKSE